MTNKEDKEVDWFVDLLHEIEIEEWAGKIENMIRSGNGIIPAFVWQNKEFNLRLWRYWRDNNKAEEMLKLIKKK